MVSAGAGGGGSAGAAEGEPPPLRKARTPKVVQKGVEMAFRKRQNAKLKGAKPRLIALLRRVLEPPTEARAADAAAGDEEGSEAAGGSGCEAGAAAAGGGGGGSAAERQLQLFREASDQLAMLGLPLGGTEAWADRLYIEGKGGSLLFSEEELDLAEEAQGRMEVLYNVDIWSAQLTSRLRSGALLLEAAAAEGTHQKTSHHDLVWRALRAIDADSRYHKEVFSETASSRARSHSVGSSASRDHVDAAAAETSTPPRFMTRHPAALPPYHPIDASAGRCHLTVPLHSHG